MTTNVAIIGLGIMGRRMLENMQRHPGYAVTALWDPSSTSCQNAAQMAPEACVATSAEAAIALADLVYLACPPVPRKAYALTAAAMGKAIFLEKPLGVNVAESEALVAGLKASGVPVAVNFTQAAGAAMTGVTAAARDGSVGELCGVDIVVTYAHWPRAWQQAADWLRFRDEGGMTREVLSHFLFFSERILGPLSVSFARPSYPADPALCETHLLARLESVEGRVVSILATTGGAQPDRQELTIKGSSASYKVTDFYVDALSNGGAFTPVDRGPTDPRTAALKHQLDDLLLCLNGQPNRLATLDEALRVQKLVETMLQGRG